MNSLLLALSLLLVLPNLAKAQGRRPQELKISSEITRNYRMPFIERNESLALNVEYDDIKKLRSKISQAIKKKLKFFDQWEKYGEAHVTTITPPEFNDQLAPYVSMGTVNAIARDLKIQSSDVKVLGLGSGKKMFRREQGETFFIIVESKNLLRIREAIYREYKRNGGPSYGPKAFKPKHFFPHITVGYTHEDIHESDGLVKDMKSSFDPRFELKLSGR